MLLVKDAFAIAKNFLASKENRIRNYYLIVFSIIFEFSLIYINVILNSWSNRFYSALAEFDKLSCYRELEKFVYLVITFVTIIGFRYVLQSKLTITFRKSLTYLYLDKWLENNTYYGLIKNNNRTDNPDQRISQDINKFVILSLDLTLGVISSIVTLVSFITILWSLSGILKFTIGDITINIKGYIVWIALAYSLLGTLIISKIGQRLSHFDYEQEQKEANFRFSMMRFQENSESISFYDGVRFEKKFFNNLFDEIINNYYSLIKVNKNLNIFNNLYANLANVLPIIVAIPKYFTKEIQLGGLMQISSAFRNVYESLSFLIQSFYKIAEYKAVVKRLTEFKKHIEDWQLEVANSNIIINKTDRNYIELINLTIKTGRKTLFKNLNFRFDIGHMYLIEGDNGSGKTSLLRSIKAIHLDGNGIINLPNSNIFYIPQRLYMPKAKLLDLTTYPQTDINENIIAEVKNYMYILGLDKFVTRLNDYDNWTENLSLGEQQKISMIRALIANADILILDEATCSITESDEEIIYNLVKEKFKDKIIISIGHRSSLKKFHNEIIEF